MKEKQQESSVVMSHNLSPPNWVPTHLGGGSQGLGLASRSGGGGSGLALLQHVEGDVGRLLARDEHGAEGGAHAGGAVHLGQLHAGQHEAGDNLPGVVHDLVLHDETPGKGADSVCLSR